MTITSNSRLTHVLLPVLFGAGLVATERAESADTPAAGSFAHSLSASELDAMLHGRPMSLTDAIDIAMGKSRPLGVALSNLDRARGAVGEAESAFLPQISVGGQAAEYDRANVFDFGVLTGGPSTPLTIAKQWNPSAFAGLTLQIDISGAVRAAASQSEFSALAARIDVDRVRNRLVLDVRSSFLQVVRANDHIRVARDNLMAADLRLRDATLNESVGNSPRFDVISARRDVAQAQAGLVAARSTQSLALAALKNVVGVNQTVSLKLTDAGAVDVPPSLPAPPPAADSIAGTIGDQTVYGPDYQAMLTVALKFRPEILESRAQVQATERGIRYAQRSTLPSLTAGLGYSYTPNAGAFSLSHSASATIALNIPVYDGGLARSRVLEARAARTNAELNYRAAVDGVELELQGAYVAVIQAEERLRLSDAGLAAAKEALRLAQERYRVGVTQSSVVSPQLELATAQAALTQADSDQVDALIDYNVARATLDHAQGKFAQTTTTAR